MIKKLYKINKNIYGYFMIRLLLIIINFKVCVIDLEIKKLNKFYNSILPNASVMWVIIPDNEFAKRAISSINMLYKMVKKQIYIQKCVGYFMGQMLVYIRKILYDEIHLLSMTDILQKKMSYK